ncbi:hypothetical protein [Dongia deserti]|uniref:hypothetical protein n=1 Tax=Dongia deserti TaxID=2268030 RepID=UPI000E653609|nr:hypothetical protein [Dongia deserti]
MADAEGAARLNAVALTGEHGACNGWSFPDEQNMTVWFVRPVVVPLLALIMAAIIHVVRSFA